MVNPGKQCHDVIGDFAGADDLLWAAQSGKLTQMGGVCVARSGRIGPLVEMLMARQSMPLAFTTVKFEAPFASTIARAISAGRIGGTAFRSRAGVFPLRCYADEGDGADRWALWRSRAEQAAIAVGFPRPLAAGIIGAMGELRENVFRHSRNADSGLAAYAATVDGFEIVISDAGIGVLESLHEHPDYADLADSGAALKVAVEDGNSRLGRASGNGFGMGQMFRALTNHDGDLRFRSEDHALIVRGHSPSLQGSVELAHKARLGGLTVTVRCASPNGHLRSA